MNYDQLKATVTLLIHSNIMETEEGYPCLKFGPELIVLKNIDTKKTTYRRVIAMFWEILEGKLRSTVD